MHNFNISWGGTPYSYVDSFVLIPGNNPVSRLLTGENDLDLATRLAQEFPQEHNKMPLIKERPPIIAEPQTVEIFESPEQDMGGRSHNRKYKAVRQEAKLFVQSLGPLKVRKDKKVDSEKRLKKIESRVYRLLREKDKIMSLSPQNPLIIGTYKGKRIYTCEKTQSGTFGNTGFEIGRGNLKVAKKAFDLYTKKVFARVTGPCNYDSLRHQALMELFEKEISMQSLFKGEKEFVQVLHSYVFPSQKGYDKRATMMEYCNSGNLEELLKKAPTSSRTQEQRDQLKSVFHDILLGLAKMEKEGVFHRDFKPANIFINQDEKGRFQGKIGDFGFAQFQGEEKLLAGTKLYMSPEYFLLHILSKKSLESKWKELKSEIEIQQGLENAAPEKLLTKLKVVENCLAFHSNKLELISSTKNDLWSAGLIIYELLYDQNLYKDLQAVKNPGNPELTNDIDLRNLLLSTPQENMQAMCKRQTFADSFEKNMRKIAAQILIVNPADRPTAREIYELYCKKFDLPPQL